MAYLDFINEKVVYKAKIHWIVFFSPILCIFIGILLAFFEINLILLGILLIIIGVVKLISNLVYVYSTELAITNKYIIGKYGFIRRETIELRLQKVESIRVNQGIIGRILDYGDVIVVGTGSSASPIRFIVNPLEFRRMFETILDKRVND